MAATITNEVTVFHSEGQCNVPVGLKKHTVAEGGRKHPRVASYACTVVYVSLLMCLKGNICKRQLPTLCLIQKAVNQDEAKFKNRLLYED